MAYLGKEFVMVNQENFDGFINALGTNVPEDIKKALTNDKPTSKLVKNGDKYTITSSNFNGVQEVTFTPGVEYSEVVFGKPAKTVTTVEGDTVTSVQTFDAGSITIKREYSANQLVVTVSSSSWEGVGKRVYKA